MMEMGKISENISYFTRTIFAAVLIFQIANIRKE